MAISIDEYKNKMENTLKIFHDELNRLRTGRATPSLLEPLFVDAYNLSQLENKLFNFTRFSQLECGRSRD